jgi:hypothetical protein
VQSSAFSGPVDADGWMEVGIVFVLNGINHGKDMNNNTTYICYPAFPKGEKKEIEEKKKHEDGGGGSRDLTNACFINAWHTFISLSLCAIMWRERGREVGPQI